MKTKDAVAIGASLGAAIVGIAFYVKATAPPPPPKMHDGQAVHCEIVDAFAGQYATQRSAGANELVLSKLRGDRAATLKRATAKAQLKMADWVGIIDDLRTTGDGLAVLSIKVPCSTPTWIKTWNNGLSDILDHTLIAQSSPVFQALMAARTGQAVRFSGEFIPDASNGLREASVGEDGSMTSPEFLFRFSSLAPL